jgi:hypothetical protein
MSKAYSEYLRKSQPEFLQELQEAMLLELNENRNGKWDFDDDSWSRFMLAVIQRLGGSEEDLNTLEKLLNVERWLDIARSELVRRGLLKLS